jgi:hypothetical protein
VQPASASSRRRSLRRRSEKSASAFGKPAATTSAAEPVASQPVPPPALLHRPQHRSPHLRKHRQPLLRYHQKLLPSAAYSHVDSLTSQSDSSRTLHAEFGPGCVFGDDEALQTEPATRSLNYHFRIFRPLILEHDTPRQLIMVRSFFMRRQVSRLPIYRQTFSGKQLNQRPHLQSL